MAALWLGADDLCRDRAKEPVSAYADRAWELDHVNDFDLGVSHGVPERIVVLCAWHHRGGWATSHRPLLREYLLRVETWSMHPRLAGRAALEAVKGIISKVMDKPADI